MKTFQPSTPRPTADRGAVVVLIRHGSTDATAARLVSRTPGIGLDARGRAEARALGRAFAHVPLAAIYSSPLQRAVETAAPIAAARGLELRPFEPLCEIDFGEWTGVSFDDLAGRNDWRRYNEQRGGACVPGGEAPEVTRTRTAAALAELSARHPGEIVAAVTHAELIRYAVLLARSAPLDDWHTVDVPTAAVVPLLCGAGCVSELRAWTPARAAIER